MNEQEIRARALEIAVLILGPNKPLSSHDWQRDAIVSYPISELKKYEFLAALIEQDILKGFPVQNENKYIFETEGSQVDNNVLKTLRARLQS